MIDIHSHILPDLDDGSRDMGESIEMARIAAEDGITHMVATPHMFNGLSDNPEPAEVVARVDALQAEIGDSLTLLPGNEVHITHDLAEKALAGELTPLNKKNYMLIEFPSMNVPVGVEGLFYRLQIQGIVPILVHPERNAQIQGHPSMVEKFIDKGVRIQVTAMSITGRVRIGRAPIGRNPVAPQLRALHRHRHAPCVAQATNSVCRQRCRGANCGCRGRSKARRRKPQGSCRRALV